MAIRIEAVDGPSVARDAALILREVWPAPAIHYTEEYLHWQLSFPSAVPMPAFMAYDASEPVGFIGTSARRLRCGPETWDSAIISFAGVRPQWRQSSVGIGIFKELYLSFRESGVPFLDFGVSGGDSQKIFMLVLARAGLKVLSLEAPLTHFALVNTVDVPVTPWEVEVAHPDSRFDPAHWFGADSGVICADPTEEQWKHYWRDPRGRAMMLLRNSSTGARGAAWVVRGEYVSREGIRIVPTVESIYLPGYDVSALRPLFHAAARWANGPARTFVNAPNLSGFDAGALSAAGIQNSGKGFLAICCAPILPEFLREAKLTTVEIV